jgi:O-antigen/teichoic acid export membrane protein
VGTLDPVAPSAPSPPPLPPDAAALPFAAGDVAAVARGGLANLVGAAVSAVANFALVIVVARFLDADAAGAFFGVTSLFLILEVVVRLGSDTGCVYFVARWREIGVVERIRPALRAALGPVLVAAVVVAAVLASVAPWLARVVADGSATSTGQLRLLALLLPVAVVYDVLLAATRGFRSMRASVLLEKLARPLVQIALVAAVLAAGWNGWLAAAWGLPYVLVLVLAVRAVRGLVVALPAAAVPVRAVAGEFWAFALPRAVAGAAQIILQRLDIVLVAALRGPRDAAVYTAASRFLVLGQFLSQAIAAPVQPRLAGALARADRPRARALYRVSTVWIVLVAWPTFLLAAVFAPEYLAVFGARYTAHAAVVVVVVLAASMLVATGVGVVDSVVLMAGKTSWNLATTLLAVVVNVVLDLVLIPPMGIAGAAVGWCAAIVVANVAPLVLAWRGLQLHPFGAGPLRAAVLSAVTFGALPFAGRLLAGLPGAVVGAVAGAALFLPAVWQQRTVFELAGLRRRGGPSA